jgi:hypothetical protein
VKNRPISKIQLGISMALLASLIIELVVVRGHELPAVLAITSVSGFIAYFGVEIIRRMFGRRTRHSGHG